MLTTLGFLVDLLAETWRRGVAALTLDMMPPRGVAVSGRLGVSVRPRAARSI
jgi:hypothetical protein